MIQQIKISQFSCFSSTFYMTLWPEALGTGTVGNFASEGGKLVLQLKTTTPVSLLISQK